MSDSKSLETFKALVDDAFWDAPLNVRQNKARTIDRGVLLAQRYVDRVVVCDDGSGDLMGEIAETTCFYVSICMDRYGV